MGLDSSFAPRGQIFHTEMRCTYKKKVKSLEAAASHLVWHRPTEADVVTQWYLLVQCRYAVDALTIVIGPYLFELGKISPAQAAEWTGEGFRPRIGERRTTN